VNTLLVCDCNRFHVMLAVMPIAVTLLLHASSVCKPSGASLRVILFESAAILRDIGKERAAFVPLIDRCMHAAFTPL
jgi:hypothetical protein